MKNKIEIALASVGLVLLLWVGGSTIEIASKNTKPNPNINKYNFYTLVTSLGEYQ